MVFSELYSTYYNVVAKILTAALVSGTTERDLQRLVAENAFSESVLTILPALRSGRWPLLNEDLSPVLHHAPTMPLTLLEKRWLKAIGEDPRVRLFGVSFPALDGIEPLFTAEDFRVYDRYGDGDPFEDEGYIRRFRWLLMAIRAQRPVQITMRNRYGKQVRMRFFPKGFEYSMKDDKIRLVVDGCRFRYFNLGRIESCRFYEGDGPWNETPEAERHRELVLELREERNTLERAMLHFAHFEKRAERTGEGKYLLHLRYCESDEMELAIRVLSFGPCVRALEPQSFVELIRERLKKQKKLLT